MNVSKKIIREYKDLSRAEIRKWRRALSMATSVQDPRTYPLQDLYDNLESDGHFIAQVALRKAATTGYAFSVYDRNSGDIDPEKTELFQAEWFYEFVEHVLDAAYKGYTLLELTDPQNLHFSLIPRRNVVGSKQLVMLNLSDDKGIDISKGFERTLIKVGRPDDLGLMQHLCGLLIWKRNSQQSWAEFTERFGIPLISATTNKTSQKDVQDISNMLETLGEASTAVLPEGTTISITPFSGGYSGSNSQDVFDALIKRTNSEIAKTICGGTMLTDDGSSRSQSEVHERNLDDKIAESDRRMVAFVVNNQLIPILHSWGYPVNPATDKFQFDAGFELSLKEHFDIVDKLMNTYEVDEQWLSKTFNIPIVGKKTTNPVTNPDKTFNIPIVGKKTTNPVTNPDNGKQKDHEEEEDDNDDTKGFSANFI